jgi:short-subunit dehydrogenase
MDRLTSSAQALAERHHVRAEAVKAELSDLRDILRLVRLIRSRKNIEVLVNNAGLGNLNPFGEDELEKHSQMILVHDLASSDFIHAVLPQMKKNRKGFIINVASMAAYAPSAVDVVYAASKAFLVNLTEGLHLSLKGTGVKVQVLCPGFTRTDFHERMGMNRKNLKDQSVFRWLSPEAVVNASIRQLGKDNPVCIPGFWYRALFHLIRFLPRQWYYRLAIGKKAES